MCLTFMLVAGFSLPPPSEEALSPFASLLLLELLLSFPPALALAFGAIVRVLMVLWWDGGGSIGGGGMWRGGNAKLILIGVLKLVIYYPTSRIQMTIHGVLCSQSIAISTGPPRLVLAANASQHTAWHAFGSAWRPVQRVPPDRRPHHAQKTITDDHSFLRSHTPHKASYPTPSQLRALLHKHYLAHVLDQIGLFQPLPQQVRPRDRFASLCRLLSTSRSIEV